MQISATGIWTSSRGRRGAGFTLIEILVVLLIIGIMIAGTVLSIGVGGGDRALEKERDRVIALTDYLRDQATLQNREYGMRCFIGGYEFLVYDTRTALWQRVEDDSATRVRRLPPGIELTLAIEGRPIVLPPEKIETGELAPQIMLFSSGEMNLFELTLQRPDGGGVKFEPSDTTDGIEVTDLATEPA